MHKILQYTLWIRTMGTVETTHSLDTEKSMSIYISKYIHVEVPDYEIELELDESEVLNDIDMDVLLEHVVGECSTSRILDRLDASDIITHIANDKQALAALLRAVADQIKY